MEQNKLSWWEAASLVSVGPIQRYMGTLTVLTGVFGDNIPVERCVAGCALYLAGVAFQEKWHGLTIDGRCSDNYVSVDRSARSLRWRDDRKV